MVSRVAGPGTFVTGSIHQHTEDNNMPGGLIGYATTSTNQGSITTMTDLTGLSQAVTVGANRAIRITGQLQLSSTATDLASLHIREGSTTLNMSRLAWSVANTGETLHVEALVMAPSTGSHTYKLSVNRDSGSGTLTTAVSGTDRPGILLIHDDGPSF